MSQHNGKKPSASPAVTFKSLGSVMAEADRQVGVKQDARNINAHELRKLKDANGFGILGASELLKELASAEVAIVSDPLARYIWIEKMLDSIASVEDLDPSIGLRFVALAAAKTLPDKKTPTRPFLKQFDRFDQALKYAEEHVGNNVRPITIPVLFLNERRNLRMRGVRFAVPNGRAELDAFHKIRKILSLVAKSAETILRAEFFFNLNVAAEWLVRSVPRAEIVTKEYLGNERFFKPIGDGLYMKPYGKQVALRVCSISDEVQLLLPDSERNQALISRMHQIRENNEKLKEGVFAIDVTIVKHLEDEDTTILSRQEFFAGKEGKVAVKYDWRKSGEVSTILMMFERRADGAWRVCLFNHAAASTLLASKEGEELRFTWFSEREVPSHLANVLRKGRIITGPADLDLTAEDLEPPQAEEEGEKPSA